MKDKIKYDLYKSPPKAQGQGTVTRYHARVSGAKTVSTTDWSKSIHRPRTDLRSAMIEISDRFLEELQKGNRVHLEGIGYFQMTLSCPPDVKDRSGVRAESIHFKSIAFTPEKSLRRQLQGAKFVRSSHTNHSAPDVSDIELMGTLTDYFKDHTYITRRELETVGGMTRSTAYRRLREWISEGKMEKISGIDAYTPVPGNFGVSRVK